MRQFALIILGMMIALAGRVDCRTEPSQAAPSLIQLEPTASAGRASSLPNWNWSDESRYVRDARFLLALDLTVEFQDREFNLPAYLQSLEHLTLTGGLPEDARVDVREVEAHLQRRWIVKIALPHRPAPETILELAVSRQVWRVGLAGLSWRTLRPTPGSSPRELFITEGRARLLAAPPAWVVVHSARLVPTLLDDEHLLEVVVENRSTVPRPLQTLVVSAARDTGVRCAQPEPQNPAQQVVLDWPSILSGAQDGTLGSRTTLSQELVRVEVAYKAGNCGDYDDRLQIRIPVRQDLDPGMLVRMSFKIVETTEDGSDRDDPGLIARIRVPWRRHPSSAPPTHLLSSWREISVSFRPSELIYPVSTSVKRE